MRRQQAQEENEARELGLLYSSVPGQNNNQQQQQQQESQPPPPSGYHAGIPSPPNEHDAVSQRIHYSGSESGKNFEIFIIKYVLWPMWFR